VAADQHSKTRAEGGAPPDAVKPEFSSQDLRHHVPAEIRNVSFPGSVRGYDRDAVDAYVRQVNRVIAELEVSRSPEAAVRHALDRVGKQTIAVLQEARESADKLMAAAREEAEEGIARAKAEAAKLVVNASAEADQTKAEAEELLAGTRAKASDILAQTRAEAAKRRRQTEEELAALQAQAEARMREIHADTEVVWKQRDELLGETHAMASRLQELASGAAARISTRNTAGPAEEPTAESEAEAEAEPNGAAANEPAEMSMVTSVQPGDQEPQSRKRSRRSRRS
jgi:DivIVA domain-containing protein